MIQDYFGFLNLSDETIRKLEQLEAQRTRFVQEAKKKVYHEMKIVRTPGITFNEYLAGFDLDNYYILTRLERKHYMKIDATADDNRTNTEFDILSSDPGVDIQPVPRVATKPRVRPRFVHVTLPSPAPVTSEKPSISFEALLRGEYPRVTVQERVKSSFDRTSVPVFELVTHMPTKQQFQDLINSFPHACTRVQGFANCTNGMMTKATVPGTRHSMATQSSAAGDEKRTTHIRITDDKVAAVKESAIFDPILATGDNSMTAAKVNKKPSVAARIGNWLRRLFPCAKKSDFVD